jgi:hydroxymethylbilane synthase
MARALRAATRGSPLARLQTEIIAGLLGVTVDVVVVETSGDRRREESIRELGGRGIFVKEVQQAVLDGHADIAVHSAKDLPSTPTKGLVLAAVPEREDPRDALVGTPLDEIRTGGRIATGSVRRRAQLAAARPDLTFSDLRGNIETRLAKATGFDAIVVAVAALRRMALDHHVAQVLDPSVVLPQVGQGALAVECRADDENTRERVVGIEDPPSRRAVDAERAFLAGFGGNCDLPVGAHARVNAGSVLLAGLIATADGRVVIRGESEGTDPAEVGSTLARWLLDEAGGRQLVESVW